MRDLPQLWVFYLRLTRIRLTYPSPIDLDLTLRSGQILTWEELGDHRQVLLFHRKSLLRVSPTPSPTTLEVNLEGDPLEEDTLRTIMGANRPWSTPPLESIRKDPFLTVLWDTYRGLTLLKQDPYECLISFMTSGVSTIPRTRRNLAGLRKRLGIPIGETGRSALPPPEIIAGLKDPERSLRALGFGYRAAFIAQTCELLAEKGMDPQEHDSLSDDEIRTWLTSLPGVGQKISECVLLFGYGRRGAFPVDVWVVRALESQWPSGNGRSPEDWSQWARDRWGDDSGLVQQLLFMWARNRG